MSTTRTQTTTELATNACPFQERFGRRPPRGFADLAAGLTWRDLLDTFAPSTDHIHLADLSRRPLGRGRTAYEATLATRDADDPTRFTARRLRTESYGDLTAMSEMLGQLGARVEIETFHQYQGSRFEGGCFEGSQFEGSQVTDTGSWCTVLRATSGRRETWAVGFGEDSSSASIAALLNAATLLHLR